MQALMMIALTVLVDRVARRWGARRAGAGAVTRCAGPPGRGAG